MPAATRACAPRARNATAAAAGRPPFRAVARARGASGRAPGAVVSFPRAATRASRTFLRVDAVAVEIRHEGKTYNLEVADGDNILDVALDAGIDLRYDCKMGVCMMCPAKVVAGAIDQSGSMLSDDVEEKGYALLCCAVPQGEDVVIQTVSEDELLEEQLCSSD